MARSTKTEDQPAAITVTVTDEQYQQLLKERLDAKHAYESNENEDEQAELLAAYNRSRSAVRKARKVRVKEAAALQQLRDAETAKQQKRSEAAKKAAATRASKKAQQTNAVEEAAVNAAELALENDEDVETAATAAAEIAMEDAAAEIAA